MLPEANTDDLLLRKLDPIREASYSEDKLCFEGSRKDTLQAIETWSESESSPPIFWLSGSPGLGKTRVAHTIAKRLRKQNRLAGYFLPDTEQNSNRILPTIAYQMAKWHADYRSNILEVLRGEQELDLYTGLNSQFKLLMKRPISEMPVHSPPGHKPLVIVLDALENYHDPASYKRSFSDYIADIASLAPWLKVFVSCRRSECCEPFRRIKTQELDIGDPALDLHHDIATYIQLGLDRKKSHSRWTLGMENDVNSLFLRICHSIRVSIRNATVMEELQNNHLIHSIIAVLSFFASAIDAADLLQFLQSI